MDNRLLLAIPIIGIGAIAIAASLQSRRESVLVISHGEHGTTDPEIGTHNYSSPTQVTITASPETGYQANWNVNGVDVAQAINSYSLYVNGSYSVAVSFVLKDGGGQPGIITGIKAIGSVATTQNFRFWYANPFATIDIAECDENWADGQCQPAWMLFKVHDAADRGVPNIQVAVYPDINPDATPYKGVVLTNGQVYSPTLPLVLTSDADGVVAFSVRTIYSADDIKQSGGGSELSRGTSLWAEIGRIPPLGPYLVMPVYQGMAAGIGQYWNRNGGGGAISYGRIIRAEVLGTDKYTIQQMYVVFNVKWKA